MQLNINASFFSSQAASIVMLAFTRFLPSSHRAAMLTALALAIVTFIPASGLLVEVGFGALAYDCTSRHCTGCASAGALLGWARDAAHGWLAGARGWCLCGRGLRVHAVASTSCRGEA